MAGMKSVLSRLVKAGLWRNDESSDDSEAPPDSHLPQQTQLQIEDAPAVAPAPAQPSRPHSPAPPSEGSDEESVESYMERLMQRVRGDAPGAKKRTTTPTATLPPSQVEIDSQPSTDVEPLA